MTNLTTLACKRVQALEPYQSARRIGGKGRIFLNANESPVHLPVVLDCSGFNRYPDSQPAEVISAYARYAGVDENRIVVSRGSDEAIELLVRTFCEPGKDGIIICSPTYGMYSICAETNGIAIYDVAPDNEFQPNVEKIAEVLAKESVKVIFLCSPNNPTGTVIDRDKLEAILKMTAGKTLVVVDEAYIEFCPEKTMLGMQATYDHLVVTRTLSKAFALAGIRCGLTIAHPDIVAMLLKVIAPYPVSVPVAQIAEQALSEDNIAVMRARVAELNSRRDSFVKSIQALSIVKKVFDMNTNYVLVQFEDSPALFNAMVNAGIILRDFNTKPMLKNCIRITIGLESEMQEVLKVLKEVEKVCHG